MKRIKQVVIALLVTVWASNAAADHETEYYSGTQPVCSSSGTEYCVSGSETGSCGKAYGRHQQLYGSGIYQYAGSSITAPGVCTIEYCTAEGSEPGCDVNQYSYTTTQITISSRIKTHDEGDNGCEDKAGSAVSGSYFQNAPETDICMANCSVDIEYQVGGGEGEDSQWWYAGLYNGESCTVEDNPFEVYRRKDPSDETQNQEINTSTGFSTEYPAPTVPPEDVDPVAEGTQPPVTEETATLTTGESVTTYTMEGGGNIFVLTDENGNVTFTDMSPLSGTAQYAAGATTGGTGGTDGGVDGSTDGTTDGSTDGTTDGGTDGGTDGTTDGEEEQGEGSASGGTSCDVAPTCSGKPIECMIVRQNWYNRCSNETIQEILETEIEPEEITGSEEAADIETQIADFQDSLINFDAGEAASLSEAVEFDGGLIKSRIGSLQGGSSCNMSSMDVQIMGVGFPFGTELCQNWGMFKATAAFMLWGFTAMTIFAMYANAMRPK